MGEIIFKVILLNGLFLLFFCLAYSSFGGIMANTESKKIKKARKKNPGFWNKFLYLDCKNRIVNWQYFFFPVFLGSFPVLLILLNLYAFSGVDIYRGLWLAVVCVFFGSYLIVAISKSRKRRKSRSGRHR